MLTPRQRCLLLRLALACVSCVAAAQAAEAAKPAFVWPHGARAAVSLAYDDGLDSQLDTVVPALKRHRLRASFYLPIASPTLPRRAQDWRRVAQAGHELGNHSLFHQCSGSAEGRSWVTALRNLDTTTAAQMREQVLLANTVLHLLDGQRERTFTPPCLDLVAGGDNYVSALAPEFVAFRARSGAVVDDMRSLDPYAVGADAMVDLTGAQLIALVQQAAAQGTMVSLTFHGVGGDFLAVSKAAHEELLQYLAGNRKTYWTDSFVNIMRHVRKQQALR